ncbi:G2/mitotic-specific cyclin-B3 isoform X1 [Alosa pseudoharengus]|uniref:G2/mitotic-specific cyclin-B3 isoform X1 n=1 Tax=Alosa pseudoharengus TaxID=34774 RepID=UPI003F8916C7
MPFSRGKKPVAISKIPKIHSKATENQEVTQVKRSSSPPKGAPKKRTAFIDITNAFSQCLSDTHIDEDDEVVQRAHKIQNSIVGIKKKDATKKAQAKQSLSERNQANLKKTLSVSSEGHLEEIKQEVKQEIKQEIKPELEQETKQEVKQEKPLAVEPVTEPASSDVPPRSPLQPTEVKPEKEEPVEESFIKEPKPAHLLPPEVPPEFDIDSANQDDCTLAPEYAKEIFDYLKKREEKFVLDDYLPVQPSITENIRAILVDWMVEVQENFELNHETLYLAVKLTDHYLAAAPCTRDLLQLIGSTAMLIAAKFEERCPPCVDDFLYICDDAYKRPQLIAMEANILKALDFDINIPISYRFLRRFAKCVGANMETLTLARFVCELSLQEMSFVSVRGSILACACLLIALVTKDICGWSPILVFHSGYSVEEVAPVVRKLHAMLKGQSDNKLEAVRSKYSHQVFFEVAKMPLVSLEKLEQFLQ